jgi:flagellar motility protein MotE (MotC chaperone)
VICVDERSHTIQMIGSLVVALVIAAVAVALVTARLGPTSAAEREVLEQRLDLREERMKQREKRIEERQKLLEERRQGG